MTNLNALIFALAIVESGNNDSAIGDEGKALGRLQIHACVVQDVNQIYGTDYIHHPDYLFDQETSEEICRKYLVYWGAHHEGRTGLKSTYEVYARIWNGGPRGNTKSKTDNYWIKVKAALEMNLGRELKGGE